MTVNEKKLVTVCAIVVIAMAGVYYFRSKKKTINPL